MARGPLLGSGPVRSGHTVFSARRRLLRPGEEYREPTAQEWQDFLAHFELRKVALCTCAREVGTPASTSTRAFAALSCGPIPSRCPV